tara:strand:+ start:15100 stop:15216 length:117 start_codon:yes stop_codon:yes gene_type:complete
MLRMPRWYDSHRGLTEGSTAANADGADLEGSRYLASDK